MSGPTWRVGGLQGLLAAPAAARGRPGPGAATDPVVRPQTAVAVPAVTPLDARWRHRGPGNPGADALPAVPDVAGPPAESPREAVVLGGGPLNHFERMQETVARLCPAGAGGRRAGRRPVARLSDGVFRIGGGGVNRRGPIGPALRNAGQVVHAAEGSGPSHLGPTPRAAGRGHARGGGEVQGRQG